MADMLTDPMVALIGAAILNLGAVIALFIFAMRQQNKAEDRQITERHESERRLTAMVTAAEERSAKLITAVEQRSTESERRLTELYREVNRDTKTIVREVAFIRGSLGISPSRQPTDPDGAAEAAD